MTWAERRKLTYVLLIIIIVGGTVFLAIRNAVNVEPTCYDKKRNGDEVGVDCGGSCAFYCPSELPPPKVLWTRVFKVTPSVAHAVAYIEHSSPSAAARFVQYQFKVYDDKNTLLAERTGSTFIGPMGKTAIVETLIPVGNVEPSLTRFSFVSDVPWEKIPQTFSSIVIKTDRNYLERYSGGTRLTATLENTSRYEFSKVDVVAMLYDRNGNVITSSKVLVPELEAESSKTIYFTWPFKIDHAVRTEIIPRFNPFTAKEL